MRTISDLPEPEISRAAALREALRLWLKQQHPRHEKVFGLWKDRPTDALVLQEALRQEWSHH